MKSLTFKVIIRFILVGFLCAVLTAMVSFYEIYQVSTAYMKSDGIKLANQIKNDIDLTGISDIAGIQSYVEIAVDMNKEISMVEFVDKNFKTIASSNKSRIGDESANKNEKFKAAMSTGDTYGFLLKLDKDGTVFDVLVPLKNGNEVTGIVSVGMKLEGMYGKIYEASITILVVVFIIIVIALIISIFLAKSIVRPINKLISDFDVISEGDLRIHFSVNTNDEISKLSDVMNGSIGNMKQTIQQIKSGTSEMDSVARDLTGACDKYTEVSRESLQGMNEVSLNVNEQVEDLTEIEKMIHEFGNNLDTIYCKLDNVAKDSVEIKVSADGGISSITAISDSLQTAIDNFQNVVIKIERLSESVNNINQIANVINNVAGQTNLLALNAAIEAARVGDAGLGFAVVADEIRILANEVLSSSKSISKIIHNVKDETREVTITSDNVSKEMEAQMVVFRDTMSNFSGILNKVSEMAPHIKDVEGTLEKSVSEKDKLLVMIESLSCAVKKVSQHAGEIAIVIESQSTSTLKLRELSYGINNISEVLQLNADKFTV